MKIETISVRELRAHLKARLDAGLPVLVGNYWHKRAIVLPLQKHSSWDKPSQRKALAAVREAFKQAVAEAFRD